MLFEKAIAPLIMLVLSVWVFAIIKSAKSGSGSQERFSECKPECCVAGQNNQFSCYGGCVCLSPTEQVLLQSRGGNSNPFAEI